MATAELLAGPIDPENEAAAVRDVLECLAADGHLSLTAADARYPWVRDPCPVVRLADLEPPSEGRGPLRYPCPLHDAAAVPPVVLRARAVRYRGPDGGYSVVVYAGQCMDCCRVYYAVSVRS